MPDKSFEQQVKDQLADLQLVPDAEVWHEVKATLHKEKKRRWLIWLFLLLAGCGGVSYWLYYQVWERQDTRWPAEKIISNVVKRSPGQEQVATELKKSEKKESELNKVNRTENKAEIKKVWEPKRAGTSKKVERLTPAEDRSLPTIVLSNPVEKPENKSLAGMPVKGMNDFPITEHHVIAENNEDEEKPLTATALNSIAEEKTVVKRNKKTRWQWAFAAGAGSSGVRNSLSLLRSSYSSAYSNVIQSAYGSSISPGKPPALRDAFSFALALQASKQLRKKRSIGVSLGYGLYQTRTGVGKRIDSSLTLGIPGNTYKANGYYYDNTNSMDYVNHYHFIQADLDLQTGFRLFRVVSLRWQLGAGVSALIASNGLHYSSSNNVLFSDRSLLTTLQANISTGFDVGIGKKQLFYIGPQWKYFISHLSKQPDEGQHLVQSTLRVSFVFPPKKK